MWAFVTKAYHLVSNIFNLFQFSFFDFQSDKHSHSLTRKSTTINQSCLGFQKRTPNQHMSSQLSRKTTSKSSAPAQTSHLSTHRIWYNKMRSMNGFLKGALIKISLKAWSLSNSVLYNKYINIRTTLHYWVVNHSIQDLCRKDLSVMQILYDILWGAVFSFCGGVWYVKNKP